MVGIHLLRHNSRTRWLVTLGVSFCWQFIVHKNLTYAGHLKNEGCKSVCSTRECIDVANILVSNMDHNINPCEDFYSFACGGYMAKHEKDSTASIMITLKDEILKVAKDIIETSDLSGSATQKLKIVYESCMDVETSESVVTKIQLVQEFLSEIGIPHWPNLDPEFSFLNTTLEEILGRLILYKEDTFVTFHPYYKEEINGIQNFLIGPSEQSYDTDTNIGNVKDLVTAILQDAQMNPGDIYKTWEEFVSLEEAISELKQVEASIACREPNATNEIIMSCRHQDLKNESMFCKILDSVIRNGDLGSTFNRDKIYLYCFEEHYMRKLPGILNRYNHRTLAHYISIRFFLKKSKYMNFIFRKRWNYIFNDTKSDKMTKLDRWKFCTSWIVNNMAIPLGSMYVLEKNDYAKEVGALATEYSDVLFKIIETQDWIQNETKRFLTNIIEETEFKLTTTYKLLSNETRVDEMYRNFHPTTKNFIRNILSNQRFLFNTWLFQEDMEIMEFLYMSMFEVEAFSGYVYAGIKFIDINVGLLLPPIYMSNAPKLFNVAGIGEVIGHEFGHTVYMSLDMARKMDNITELDFEERRQCLIDHYSNFELKTIGKNVQGNVTIAENFPDNVSIQVTEKIAEKLLRNMTEDMFSLPGLPYSPEELFYIQYAQLWCGVRSVEMEEQYSEDMSTVDHLPPWYRLTGILQNSKRFSEVFKCPSTSFMNPEKKCSVFDS